MSNENYVRYWSGLVTVYDEVTNQKLYMSFSKKKSHNSISHRKNIRRIIGAYYYITCLDVDLI